jgi:glycosyltransferase involved in cell wall biosynthesis
MIGICAPYKRCEATTAALRLADFAVSRSLGVKFLGIGLREQGIHRAWDSRISTAKGEGVYHWARGCKYLVWFDHQPALLKQAKLVAEKATHCLVPLWHRLSKFSLDDFDFYSRVVCPLKSTYKQFVAQGLSNSAPKRLVWCGWDAGLEPVQRGRLVAEGQIHFYVPMDSYAMDEVGLHTLCVLDDLLKAYPHLHVRLDCAKSWPRLARRTVQQYVATWAPRLHCSYHTSLLTQVTYFHNADWTFLPAVRGDIGMTALRSQACHVPVVAYDISPFSDVVRNCKDGLLMACDTSSNWLGAPIAIPSLAHALESLGLAAEDEHCLHECRKVPWQAAKRMAGFTAFWSKEFGVE